jgi:hypothetical protein
MVESSRGVTGCVGGSLSSCMVSSVPLGPACGGLATGLAGLLLGRSGPGWWMEGRLEVGGDG